MQEPMTAFYPCLILRNILKFCLDSIRTLMFHNLTLLGKQQTLQANSFTLQKKPNFTFSYPYSFEFRQKLLKIYNLDA